MNTTRDVSPDGGVRRWSYYGFVGAPVIVVASGLLALAKRSAVADLLLAAVGCVIVAEGLVLALDLQSAATAAPRWLLPDRRSAWLVPWTPWVIRCIGVCMIAYGFACVVAAVRYLTS